MTLTDCFAPFLAYLLHFQRTASENVKPVDEIRSELLALLTQGEEGAQRGEIPPTIDRARFALCAFADEVILNSSYGAWSASWLNLSRRRMTILFSASRSRERYMTGAPPRSVSRPRSSRTARFP